MPEYILLVDENDKVVGKEEKMKCHEGKGILHRAFTAMIFNNKNELLLTKRSRSKKLWSDFWDGSISSHVWENESYEDAVKRRLPDELGVKTENVRYLFKIRYQTPYKNIGSENEICAAVIVKGIDRILPDREEISDFKFMNLKDIEEDLKKNPEIYAPWFLLIFKEFIRLKKYQNIFK